MNAVMTGLSAVLLLLLVLALVGFQVQRFNRWRSRRGARHG